MAQRNKPAPPRPGPAAPVADRPLARHPLGEGLPPPGPGALPPYPLQESPPPLTPPPAPESDPALQTSAELLLIIAEVLGDRRALPHRLPAPTEQLAFASAGADPPPDGEAGGAILLLDRLVPASQSPAGLAPAAQAPLADRRTTTPPVPTAGTLEQGLIRLRMPGHDDNRPGDHAADDPARTPRVTGPAFSPGADPNGPGDRRVRPDGSVARGLAFGLPLSLALWAGLVVLGRWLLHR